MAGISGINPADARPQPAVVRNSHDAQAAQAAQAEGRQGYDFAAMVGPAYKLDGKLAGVRGDAGTEGQTEAEIMQMKRTGKIECQTCKQRTYQDGSDDPGVSFKAPGHISPESSFAVVSSHESEHVANEQADARAEGRQVIGQSVRVFMATCAECGRAYASGGVTTTTTIDDPDARSGGQGEAHEQQLSGDE